LNGIRLKPVSYTGCVRESGHFNLLTPNDPYIVRTAPLTSKRYIFIYWFNKYRYWIF